MIADKLRTNIALFVMTNFAKPSKKFDIAWKPSAVLDLCGVLGALGRRFESCRPESIKSKSYQRVSRLAFLFLICLKISTGEDLYNFG